ncbi:helix-turn-helix transcriptional regulator [Nocardiopsis gilva]
MRGDRKFNEVVKAARTTGGSLARWETPGDRGAVPGPAALERLCQLYGAEERFDELLELRRQARQPDRWQPYELERSYRTYANIEAQASSIDNYQSQLIPGIVQTEAYARAVIEATLHPASEVEREVRVRLERQELMRSPERPELRMVITEGAIRQQVGPVGVMVEQLQRLIELSEQPDITVQVLPFSAGAHVAMTLPAFVILRVAQHGLAAVYTESRASSLFLTNQEDLDQYTAIFDRLRVAALDEGDPTHKLLESVLQVHRSRED